MSAKAKHKPSTDLRAAAAALDFHVPDDGRVDDGVRHLSADARDQRSHQLADTRFRVSEPREKLWNDRAPGSCWRELQLLREDVLRELRAEVSTGDVLVPVVL